MARTDFVSYSRWQYHNSHSCIQEFQLRQYPTQNRKRRNRISHACKKHEVGKLDFWVYEFFVYSMRETRPNAKWKDYAHYGNGGWQTSITFDNCSVYLEANEEEKKTKTDISN